MSILVIGVNHRSGPLSLLERVSLQPDEARKAVAGLAMRDNVREVAVLSTCNRTEVYAVAEKFHGAYADIRDFLCDVGGFAPDDLHAHLYTEHDDAAVAHLFEVAAGLDSAVLGESEILGQVRQAWELAQAEGGSRTTLNLLFRHALSVGKRARTETGIGRGTASVSHAAVGVDEVAGAIAVSDLVLTCTGAGTPVLTEHVVCAHGRERPLLIVDIAVPRDVEPAVRELPGITVLDLDDLRDWADRARANRLDEAERVRVLVRDEVERFAVESTALQAAPLIASMHERAESVRSSELERFASRLTGLDATHRDAVEALTRSIVAKLLHQPSVRLKQQAGSPQGERNAAAVADLFDLG
jgi:glutamyl-tRNA reductase